MWGHEERGAGVDLTEQKDQLHTDSWPDSCLGVLWDLGIYSAGAWLWGSLYPPQVEAGLKWGRAMPLRERSSCLANFSKRVLLPLEDA